VVDTKAINQPLTVKARIGTMQKIEVSIKLISKAEAFLTKIRITVEALNGDKMPISSSGRGIVVVPVEVTKPNTRPLLNRKVATKIHLL